MGRRSPPTGLGWAGLLQFSRLHASVSTGGNSWCGLHLWAGGDGPRLTGLRTVGVCGPLGGLGVPWGVGLFVAGVYGLPGVKGGESCIVGASVAGVCGFRVAAADLCRRARGSGRLLACLGHWVESGKGGAGGVGRGSRVVCPCSCSLAVLCMCGLMWFEV